MLDFLACQSPEKLVVDAEGIAMAQRLLAGIEVRTDMLATTLFEGINFKGDFLKQRITRELFPKEQHIPSAVIDRDSIRGWQASGRLDTFARAKARTKELLDSYKRPIFDPRQEKELHRMVEDLAKKAGMDALPQMG
jgi:trimethylamine:corrinoid methyltransferase-like protein